MNSTNFQGISILPQAVLSFHGGGSRGLLSLAMLSEVEKDHRIIANGEIQLFAGTSTGSIIAVALGLGISLDTILVSYKECLPEIFPWYKCKLRGMKFLGVFFSAFLRYNKKTLRKCLRNVLLPNLKECESDVFKFGKCKHRTLIVAVRLEDYKPVVFDSKDAEHGEYSLVDVVMASCAAPFFFRPHKVKDANGCCYSYIDGGLAANSPSLCAINALLKDGITMDSINLMSFGTGAYPEWNASKGRIGKCLPMNTGKDAFKCSLNSNVVISEDVCRTILGSMCHLSLNAPIGELIRLDDASQPTLERLEKTARLAYEEPAIQDAVKQWIGNIRQL